MVHSVDKIHVLVVTMELFLLLFFRICSYVTSSRSNQPMSKLHCFLLDLRCSKWLRSILQVFLRVIVYLCNLFLLSTPAAQILLTLRLVR